MKMFVHPKLMVFFPMSRHLAYEFCFSSYALGSGGGMGGEYIFATVIIWTVSYLSNICTKLFSILSEDKFTNCIDLRKSNAKLHLVWSGGKVRYFCFGGGNVWKAPRHEVWQSWRYLWVVVVSSGGLPALLLQLYGTALVSSTCILHHLQGFIFLNTLSFSELEQHLIIHEMPKHKEVSTENLWTEKGG